jgi:AmmeMemoRadiSam system protein B
MMNLRESCLPAGWYPRSETEISRFLKNAGAEYTAGPGFGAKSARAAIAPHAGWSFSGKIAAAAVSALDKEAETLVVLGGHLPAGMPPLFAEEDGVKTPLGPVMIDAELRDAVKSRLKSREDRREDNTIEVLLPMVRFFYPQARLLWIRLPAELASYEAGKILAQSAAFLKRRVAVLGSTDLTHYGPNYDFAPMGNGIKALRWVTEVNDKGFIKAVESNSPEDILYYAEHKRAACSAGAVLGAAGFAAETGSGHCRLLAYGTSAAGFTAEIPDSFVGYGAFAYF